MIRPILLMGDPRLFERSRPVERLGTGELLALVGDLHETMVAAKGAGLAAPQIGVGLRVVIFGFEHSQRYPDATAETTLLSGDMLSLPHPVQLIFDNLQTCWQTTTFDTEFA